MTSLGTFNGKRLKKVCFRKNNISIKDSILLIFTTSIMIALLLLLNNIMQRG